MRTYKITLATLWSSFKKLNYIEYFHTRLHWEFHKVFSISASNNSVQRETKMYSGRHCVIYAGPQTKCQIEGVLLCNWVNLLWICCRQGPVTHSQFVGVLNLWRPGFEAKWSNIFMQIFLKFKDTMQHLYNFRDDSFWAFFFLCAYYRFAGWLHKDHILFTGMMFSYFCCSFLSRGTRCVY